LMLVDDLDSTRQEEMLAPAGGEVFFLGRTDA